MNLVIGALLPLRIVEVQEFKELITTLQPQRHVLCRTSLRALIVGDAATMKEKLISLLKMQDFVATTTDCWSAYGRSYLGVTVHWIDGETFQRKSAYLALRRLQGRHTYDVLAAALDDVHAEYNIRKKIVRTTTDNGANFVKAFAEFSSDRSAMAEDRDDVDDAENADADDDEGTDPVDVYLTLSEGESDNDYSLPPHQRCACHTLNLIATTDAEAAESDAAYKKIFRCTFAKCQGLWNKYGRSAMAVEAVNDAYGLGLKRPNVTRWNSVFFAVERLVRLIKDQGDEEFRKLCSKLEVPRFTAAEVKFLEEYLSVMKPVTQVLNILQSEGKMFMGFLLPTISILREKLSNLQATANTCIPLVNAVLAGIDRRFAEIFGDKEAIAAAILHPQFRTTWTDDHTLIDLGMRHIRFLLQTSAAPQPEASTGEIRHNISSFHW